MGLFNFLKSKKNGGTTEQKVFLSEENNTAVSFEKAEKLRAQFISLMSQDKRSEKFNIASSMLLNRAYDASIDCYNYLMEKYPDSIAECQSQIGACYYFTKEYKKAIEYYLVARKNGANESMMDDNVWEACEALFKIDKNPSVILDYLDHYPEGNYKKKAKRILLR